MVSLSGPAFFTVASGGLLVALGYLIRFRGWTFLIAGYDDSVDIPADLAANATGNTMLRIGLGTVALGILEAVSDPPEVVWLVYIVAVTVDTARLVYRLNTYEARAAPPDQ